MAGLNRGRLDMWHQWLFHPLATWQTQNRERATEALQHLQSRYHTFRALLEDNNRSLSLLTDVGMKLRNANVDQRVRDLTEELLDVTGNLVDKLDQLGHGESGRLAVLHDKLADRIGSLFAKLPHEKVLAPVVPLDTVTDDMRPLVGGKAAVLSQLRRKGSFRVPAGFVIPLSSCLFHLPHVTNKV